MKKLKIWIVGILAVVALVFMAFTPIILAGADEVAQTTESVAVEETTESVADEETTESETEGNTGVLEGETQDKELTLDELSQIIADYLASKKTEDGAFDFWTVFKDAQTWVTATFGAIGGLVLAAVFAAILGHFKNKGVINTEKNVEQIAAKAATCAVKGIVGNAINLDISAELNKTVERFMYGIKTELDGTFDILNFVEILTAKIAQALSKSRVLTKEEQEQLQSDASAVMAHAQKGSPAIKAPAAVVVSEKKEEEKTATATASVTEDNGYTLNFGGI